jgi:tetratricopeptide (TPR) repeat protein
MTARRDPSYADLVYDALRSAGRPLTFQEIFDLVNQRRPVTTKNPKGTIRNALTAGRQLVSLGDGRYGYLPHLVQGSLLRLPLTEKKPADHPLTYSDELRQALWPSFLEIQKRQDRGPVRARLPDGAEAVLSLDFVGPGTWGCPMPESLRRFLVHQRATAGDSLLMRIVGGETNSCEIHLESRLKRDKRTLAARNRELADATAQLYRERGSIDIPIWDLVILLLARGAYRSEVAPDPLDTILLDDPRFEYAGLHGWILAEAMTPAMKAEIRRRQQLEREMLSVVSGADDGPEPVDSPLSGRSMLERAMADVGALLAERAPATIDEANALLQELLTHGDLPHRRATTPLEQAQELMYDALETSSPRERVRLARRALEISSDCADAYVLLAEETARSPQQAAELYAQGVAAGERALGEEAFEQGAGSFWGILETRPYMRARLGLAEALWSMGDQQAAIEHLRDMLRLNPGDNQGVRYMLLTCLLDLDDVDAIQQLLDAYPDDVAAVWVYGRVLHAFRREGDTPASRRLRADARRWNPHVPAYLAGRKRLPRRLPAMIGMGDESEAIYCAAEQMSAWRATPGALAWLDSGPR